MFIFYTCFNFLTQEQNYISLIDTEATHFKLLHQFTHSLVSHGNNFNPKLHYVMFQSIDTISIRVNFNCKLFQVSPTLSMLQQAMYLKRAHQREFMPYCMEARYVQKIQKSITRRITLHFTISFIIIQRSRIGPMLKIVQNGAFFST